MPARADDAEIINRTLTINWANLAGSARTRADSRGAKPVQGFFDFVKSLGAARMAAMAAVTLALIGFFAFLIVRDDGAANGAAVHRPVARGLSARSSRTSSARASPIELKNDGAIVLVPKDQVARLRMKLAESGLPKGGGVGYEIFDKSDALGATSFVQNINHLRALEGELARTIRSLDRVQAARVHLVLPERPLFSRDKVEPSASIVLKVRGSARAAAGARHPPSGRHRGQRAEAERVSVVDEAGRLLADGAARRQFARRRQRRRAQSSLTRRRLREQVESIVSSVVGPGRARVQLTADFDFNRITQTSDKFDPEGRVVRSSQTREEQSASGEQDRRPGLGRQRTAGRQRSRPTARRAASATRTARPRKSSITRSRAPPRPK